MCNRNKSKRGGVYTRHKRRVHFQHKHVSKSDARFKFCPTPNVLATALCRMSQKFSAGNNDDVLGVDVPTVRDRGRSARYF